LQGISVEVGVKGREEGVRVDGSDVEVWEGIKRVGVVVGRRSIV
jgi:hypothetical protein